jgi:hypothetical protein
MPGNNSDLEKRLWSAADELRANSKLKASEYSVPVLGLIFLRYAGARFAAAERQLNDEAAERSARRRGISKSDYQARGVLYVPEAARFARLADMPEGANVGKEINDAMRAIEEENEDLRDVLPKTYNRLENSVLRELIRIMNSIQDIEGDAFGKIYEYFLGHFALSEGQRGGEFFTPTPIVKLIVEILEPFHGLILDPACGSGGMFVQSADFIHRRRRRDTEISIYGQERVAETVRLCRMNLAVHGLHGDIKQGNSYYEDNHNSPGEIRLCDGQSALQRGQDRQGEAQGRHAPLPVRHAARRQRQLPVDPAVLQRAERQRAGGLRDGEQRQRRAPVGRRDPPEADPGWGGGRDGGGEQQLLLQRDAAGNAVVPGQGQSGARPEKTRCCLSTPAASTARSTGRTASLPARRSTCWQISCACTGARN